MRRFIKFVSLLLFVLFIYNTDVFAQHTLTANERGIITDSDSVNYICKTLNKDFTVSYKEKDGEITVRGDGFIQDNTYFNGLNYDVMCGNPSGTTKYIVTVYYVSDYIKGYTYIPIASLDSLDYLVQNVGSSLPPFLNCRWEGVYFDSECTLKAGSELSHYVNEGDFIVLYAKFFSEEEDKDIITGKTGIKDNKDMVAKATEALNGYPFSKRDTALNGGIAVRSDGYVIDTRNACTVSPQHNMLHYRVIFSGTEFGGEYWYYSLNRAEAKERIAYELEDIAYYRTSLNGYKYEGLYVNADCTIPASSKNVVFPDYTSLDRENVVTLYAKYTSTTASVTTEVATTEKTTEKKTTEARTTETVTESEKTTEKQTEDVSTEESTEKKTTEARTTETVTESEKTTERQTEDIPTEESTEKQVVDISTEKTTERQTEDVSTEESTEKQVINISTEKSTERQIIDISTEKATGAGSTEGSTQVNTTEERSTQSTTREQQIGFKPIEATTENLSTVDVEIAESIPKARISSIASKKKGKVTLKFKVTKGFKIEVQSSTSKKFTSTMVYTTSRGTLTKKFKSKKTYYFRVRYFHKDGNLLNYGKWSKVKKIKVK